MHAFEESEKFLVGLYILYTIYEVRTLVAFSVYYVFESIKKKAHPENNSQHYLKQKKLWDILNTHRILFCVNCLVYQ
jgi:hypothetical protein